MGRIDKALIEKYTAYEKPDMSETDRLGLAYCRLNNWLWDDIVGECPKDFYNLPCYGEEHEKTRRDYTHPPLEEIRAKLGAENCSKYHWLYSMEKTENEWREWYFGERPRKDKQVVKYVKNPVPKLLVWLVTPMLWFTAHPVAYWITLAAVWLLTVMLWKG